MIPNYDCVKVVVAGDFFPGDVPDNDFWNNDYLFHFKELINKLRGSDINILNLECPLTTSNTPITKNGPCLRAQPVYAQKIKSLGFNVVSLANNHIMDMGKHGLEDTIRTCGQNNLSIIGAGENLEQASRILFIEVKGLKIAIISIAENEFSISDSRHPGSCTLNLPHNYHQILEARSQSDFVMVIYHGGNEYFHFPSPRLVETCHFFVDIGANAVICHHSHVSSGYETYKNSFISYGLGNFFFPTMTKRKIDWFQGYLVELEVRKILEETTFSWSLIPYYQNLQSKWKLMNKNERIIFMDQVVNLSRTITNNEALFREWELFYDSNSRFYFSSLLGLNKIERGFLKIGVWPFWRYQKKKLPIILNIIRCESHRDVMISLLEKMVKDKIDG